MLYNGFAFVKKTKVGREKPELDTRRHNVPLP